MPGPLLFQVVFRVQDPVARIISALQMYKYRPCKHPNGTRKQNDYQACTKEWYPDYTIGEHLQKSIDAVRADTDGTKECFFGKQVRALSAALALNMKEW